MTADKQREKIRAHMEEDFLPQGQVDAQNRVANALEYIAYHLGQIDKKLDAIIGGAQKAGDS